jgi:hypothetical protein
MGSSLILARSADAKKVADSLTEFETYIHNNREFIPNFGERRRQAPAEYLKISRITGMS